MKIAKFIYGIIGVGLSISVAVTGSYGLSKENREIYQTAQNMQADMDKLGFDGFKLSELKTHFFDGDNDYVVYDGKITKEPPAFRTFVATAPKIDGTYQVVIPTFENFSKMFDLLNSVESVANGQLSFEEGIYGTNEHIATLWHESFHAYQFSRQEDGIMEMVIASDRLENLGMETLIVNYVDSDSELVLLFSEEMDLLIKAYKANTDSQKLDYLSRAMNIEQKRKARMDDDVTSVEQYYQTIEGSACYVESHAYRLLKGSTAWENQYLVSFSYENGSGKYYRMGMVKWGLLHQLEGYWENDFTINLDQKLLDILNQAE